MPRKLTGARARAQPTVLYGKHPNGHGSRRGIQCVDRRTREYGILEGTREMLIEHLGGPEKVTIAQSFLIERACWLALECAMHDQKMLEGTTSEYDGKRSLAAANSFVRTVQKLGLKQTVVSLQAQTLASLRSGK
jgi:hypothetical protein